ncbi:MAG TPA: PIN domain-containing protein [Acidimicrobiia bacterium]|nr:PIN domain-containing protein [Acidimicrobiia bacterium]
MRFVDTSWWAAWALPDDPRHHEAIAVTSRLAPAEQVLTTNRVVAETWTLLSRRAGVDTAAMFGDRVARLSTSHRLTVVEVDALTESKAWIWLRDHDEYPYSFVDGTSFMVMRARRIREAFAFGDAFTAAGFVEARA